MKKTLKNLFSFFSARQKVHLAVLFVLMLIGAFMEVMSVSMLVPLIAVMLRPDEAGSGTLVMLARRFLPSATRESFVVTGIAFVIALVVVKTVFLLFEYALQAKFVYNNRFRLQRRMLHAFFCRPYEYYLNAEAGEILRVIQGDVIMTFDMVTALLNLATDLTISAVLTAAVFVISPVMTAFVACAMLLTVIVIAKWVKPMQKRQGMERNILTARSNKWLMQSITGIREIKISRREEYFEDNYLRCGEETIRLDRIQAVLRNTPRLVLEMVSLCVMLSVLGVMILRGAEPSSLIPELSAFAMAAVKMIPCMNRVTNYLNQVTYGTHSLEKVMENLRALNEVPEHLRIRERDAQPLPFAQAVELQDVSYRYPGTATDVLSDVDLTIPRGSCIGIVGASGAGKTTTVDVLVGLLTPQRGSILIDGTDIRTDYPGWLAHIGYIPQMIFLLDDTIRANVAFGVSEDEQSEERIWNALEEAQLAEFVRSLPDGLDTRVGERGVRLSGGQRQRLGIARALYGDPDILIFDEATSALDTDTESAVMDSVYRLQGSRTMIIITHRLTTIRRCDTIYEVRDRGIRQKGTTEHE